MIALSCGLKISAVRHLVLSQSTRVTDGQTDGQTDGRTDRITTPKTARAYARAVLGVVILSVRLSHAWIVTKLNDYRLSDNIHLTSAIPYISD